MSAQGKGDIWQSYHLSNLRMKYTSILYRLFLLFHFVRCCAAIARCGISFISMAHRAHRLLAYTHCVVRHQWQVQAAALHSQLPNNHFVLYSHLRINPVSQFVQYRFLIAWHSSKNFRMNSKKKKIEWNRKTHTINWIYTRTANLLRVWNLCESGVLLLPCWSNHEMQLREQMLLQIKVELLFKTANINKTKMNESASKHARHGRHCRQPSSWYHG